jgi:hypothetical protein
MNPCGWRLWFDLGTVTSGRERRSAFAEAAALNPRQPEIVALRDRGDALPAPEGRCDAVAPGAGEAKSVRRR